MTKVATASRMAFQSRRRPPNNSPAKTMRFLVHCSGRRETRSSLTVERGEGWPAGCASSGPLCSRSEAREEDRRAMTARIALSDVGRRGEAPDGVRFVVVRLEDREQLCN